MEAQSRGVHRTTGLGKPCSPPTGLGRASLKASLKAKGRVCWERPVGRRPTEQPILLRDHLWGQAKMSSRSEEAKEPCLQGWGWSETLESMTAGWGDVTML